MAASLMSGSLFSPGTLKHVVPWKTREEFLSVYTDLYSKDEQLQQQAIDKINMWKSRAGSKLSVAIESTGNLLQALLDFSAAKREGQVFKLDFQLRSTFSLTLIRFVNHITEKGQTKAVAQPVHIVAKEFDIPEWIVRLRHEATHNTLPSLDTLVCGVRWAVDYLEQKFWEPQRQDSTFTEGNKEEQVKGPSMATIRNAIYDFQKTRFQEIGTSREKKEPESPSHHDCLRTLQKYLTQNRLRFIQCLLEDGVLVATEDQLAAFGIQADDLLAHLPPTIPLEMTEFWRPLLKKIHSNGALSLLLQTILFSVTSEESLGNYQLVAWLMYMLTQGADAKGKRRKKKKPDDLFKTPPCLPKKILLTACLQNINTYTAFLLQHLVDKESLGQTAYSKLTKLLALHTKTTSHSTSSDDSDDSETVYTVQDVKKARHKQSEENKFSESAVSQLESTVEKSDIPWKLCTDLVDWSTVPFGAIPLPSDDKDDDMADTDPPTSPSHEERERKRGHDDSSDEERGDYKHSRRSRSRSSDDDDDDKDSDDDDDDNDEDDDDDDGRRRRQKRGKFVASDDIL